ncbi:hypothetical protein K457DRAFT_1441005 [Linnemannia elongata AG-77]|uniref:Uncharacterized protein n=1 Tax=Linnemannia elongata AG-77 TaxID=1314771 RepID=A0A197JVF1_9FUNG|nr:hypothetical protein K457DRAFT_1441005 [Linnemannia elongata AG-77]
MSSVASVEMVVVVVGWITNKVQRRIKRKESEHKKKSEKAKGKHKDRTHTALFSLLFVPLSLSVLSLVLTLSFFLFFSYWRHRKETQRVVGVQCIQTRSSLKRGTKKEPALFSLLLLFFFFFLVHNSRTQFIFLVRSFTSRSTQA